MVEFLFRNKWVLAAGCVFFLGTAIAGGLLWRHYETHVSTDDAFVEGRVSPVSAMVTGSVLRVLVDDNQEVKKGQALVELDPKYYQAKLEQAEAAVAIAESQLKAAQEQVSFSREIISSQVAQAEAALQASSSAIQASHQVLDQAKAILASRKEALAVAQAELKEKLALEEKAKIDYDRMLRLLEKKAISRVEYDLAKVNHEASSAQVAAAKRKVLLARRELEAAFADRKAKESGYAYSPLHLGVKSAKAKAIEAEAKLAEARAKERSVKIREAERELASARLEEALANLKYAKNQLEDTVIRAPMAGRVTKKNVEVGQVVHPGQPLISIVSLHDLWIVANFKETQLTHVRPGQRVKITVDTYPGKIFTGTVDSMQAGTGSRFSLLPPENATGNFVKVVQRIPVKIVLDNQSNPSIFMLGMSVVPTIELR
ncbi:MAG: HlyD family secretion protein [Deltaproteobacteria bacterium]|nr:MAG: HlyD family secretion protein [Deltaproteobacteria bacterium]